MTSIETPDGTYTTLAEAKACLKRNGHYGDQQLKVWVYIDRPKDRGAE